MKFIYEINRKHYCITCITALHELRHASSHYLAGYCQKLKLISTVIFIGLTGRQQSGKILNFVSLTQKRKKTKNYINFLVFFLNKTNFSAQKCPMWIDFNENEMDYSTQLYFSDQYYTVYIQNFFLIVIYLPLCDYRSVLSMIALLVYVLLPSCRQP